MGFVINGEDKVQQTRKSKKTIEEMFNDEFDNEAFGIYQTVVMDDDDIITQYEKPMIPKKILIAGPNGTGKSSLGLSLLTHDLQENDVFYYVDIDKSGEEIMSEFFGPYRHQIRHLKPYVTKKDDEGNTIRDDEGIVKAVQDYAQEIRKRINDGMYICKHCGAYLKHVDYDEDINNALLDIIKQNKEHYMKLKKLQAKNKGKKKTPTDEELQLMLDKPPAIPNIVLHQKKNMVCPYCGKKHLEVVNFKGVIVDGLSFLLEFCEAVMRIERDIPVDAGVPMLQWKLRNDAYKKCEDAFMSLDILVIFIAHEDFIPELQEKFASVKERTIDAVSVRINVNQKHNDANPKVLDSVATIRKNRSDLTTVNDQYTFLSYNEDTKVIDTDIEKLYKALFSPKQNQREK